MREENDEYKLYNDLIKKEIENSRKDSKILAD